MISSDFRQGSARQPRVVLVCWVIYENPTDYPGKFVVRPQSVVSTDDNRTAIVPGNPLVLPTLEQARYALPVGLTNLGRQPGDDPVIKEVWV